MRKVKLYTSDGGFVVGGLVPPFMDGLEAEIIVWGIRTFKIKREDYLGRPLVDSDGAFHYMEVFAVALVAIDSSIRG